MASCASPLYCVGYIRLNFCQGSHDRWISGFFFKDFNFIFAQSDPLLFIPFVCSLWYVVNSLMIACLTWDSLSIVNASVFLNLWEPTVRTLKCYFILLWDNLILFLVNRAESSRKVNATKISLLKLQNLWIIHFVLWRRKKINYT